jgi:hypothetical protein
MGAKGPPIEGQPIAIGLLVAAVLILVAVFSYSWVTVGNEGGVGPLGFKACRRGMCQSISWGDMGGKTPGDWSAFGYLTLLGGLAAAAGAGACGVLMLTRKPGKMPYKPARIAIGVAAGCAAFWVMRILTHDEMSGEGAGPGWSTFVGFGGLIAAGVLVQKAASFAVYAPKQLLGGPPMGAAGGYGQPMGGAPYGQQPMGGPPMGGAPGGYGQQPMGGPPMAGAPMGGPPMGGPAMNPGTAPTMASGPQPGAHPCPRCQRGLVFVAQYQRWFCESCKQYA